MEQTEEYIKWAFALIGVFISKLVGGWDTAVKILLVFVVMDYVTGVMASWYEQKLSSRIGMFGIGKKVYVFIMVAAAHMVDLSMGDGHIFRDAIAFFYIANELLSLIENAGRMGVPVPKKLRKAVEVLRDESGE